MKRRRWWVLASIVGGLALIGIALDLLSASAWRDAQEAARRAGLPLTASEMRATPPNPIDNAAGSYRRAIDICRAIPKDDRLLLEYYRPSLTGKAASDYYKPFRIKGTVNRARVDAILPKYQSAFDEVAAGTAKPYLVWDRQWELGYKLELPELYQLKQLCGVLRLDVDLAVEQKDWVRAMMRLRQIQRIGEQVQQEPSLISFLSGNTMRLMAVQKAIQQAFENPALVEPVRRFLTESPLSDLGPAMKGEVYFATFAIDRVTEHPGLLTGTSERSGSPADDPTLFHNLGYAHLRLIQLGWVHNSAKSTLVARFARAIRALDPSDGAKAEAALGTLDKEIERDYSLPGRFTNEVVPLFQPAAVKAITTQTWQRLGLVLTHLVDEKERTGHWPKALPKLGEWSNDPFTEKPFHYRLTNGGFTVYSVGPDRLDGGGDLIKRCKDLSIGCSGGELQFGS